MEGVALVLGQWAHWNTVPHESPAEEALPISDVEEEFAGSHAAAIRCASQRYVRCCSSRRRVAMTAGAPHAHRFR